MGQLSCKPGLLRSAFQWPFGRKGRNSPIGKDSRGEAGLAGQSPEIWEEMGGPPGGRESPPPGGSMFSMDKVGLRSPFLFRQYLCKSDTIWDNQVP